MIRLHPPYSNGDSLNYIRLENVLNRPFAFKLAGYNNSCKELLYGLIPYRDNRLAICIGLQLTKTV